MTRIYNNRAKSERKAIFFSRAYVDSGASFSIFNAEIADYLGLDYRKGDKIYPAGVRGHADINKIFISIQDVEIRCKVLFSDEFTVKFNLLGRAGIFNRFRVCFDDLEKKLYMFLFSFGKAFLSKNSFL